MEVCVYVDCAGNTDGDWSRDVILFRSLDFYPEDIKNLLRGFNQFSKMVSISVWRRMVQRNEDWRGKEQAGMTVRRNWLEGEGLN